MGASLIFENDAELRDFETSLHSGNGEREREKDGESIGDWYVITAIDPCHLH